jgi:hypothetical protein
MVKDLRTGVVSTAPGDVLDGALDPFMAEAQAPVDVIGTGSYLPERWGETYATADIVEYDGVRRVKVGREFLFRK